MYQPLDCRYCDTAFASDEALATHLASDHDRGDLSRIDKQRVKHHNEPSASSVRELRVEKRISRRATLAAAAIGVTGIGGIAFSAAGSSNLTSISNWNDLDDIRDDLGDDYILVNDLDEETEGYDAQIGDPADGWDPINDFSGSFDGDGHSIVDLTIDRSGEDDVGLFGENMAGTIEDIILLDVTIHGQTRTAGISGVNNGTITDVIVTGNIDGISRVAGVSGENYGTIERVMTNTDVYANSERVGGIVGHCEGTIQDSYTLGETAAEITGKHTWLTRLGGVVGRKEGGNIERCYVAGPVVNVLGSGSDHGALVGRMTDSGSIIDCYWDKGTTNQDDAYGSGEGSETTSGEVGFGSTSDTEPADEMTGSEAETNMTAFDFASDWHPVIAEERVNPRPDEDGYPILQAIDAGTQLDAQDVPFSVGGSIGSLNIRDSTFKNNSIGISIGDDE